MCWRGGLGVVLLLLGACLPPPVLVPKAPGFRERAALVPKPWPNWLVGWAEAELCSGRTADLTKVRWWLLPDSSFTVDSDTTRVIGFVEGNNIYLAEPWAWRTWLPRHEALHVRGYDGTHRKDIFVERCKALGGHDPQDSL